MKKIAYCIVILILGIGCNSKNSTPNVTDLLKKGDSLMAQGQLPAAINVYDSVLLADNQNIRAALQKTLALIQNYQYANAIQSAGDALQLADTATAYYYRANAHRFMGNYAEAITDYTTAVKKAPENYDYVHERGIARLHINSLDSALQDFMAAKNINPIDPRAFLSIGSTYTLKKDFGAALRFYEQSLGLKPDYYQALNAKCRLLRDIGQIDSCISTLYTAINYHQDSAELYKLRCDMLFKKQRYNEAVIDAGVLIRLMPNKAPYYNVRGYCKMQQDKIQEALDDFNNALKTDSTYAYAWSNKGYCHYLLKDYPSAMKYIYHSLQLDANNSFAYRNLALVQIAQKQKAEACQSINLGLTMGFTKQYGDELEKLKKQHCR
ncbi:tetratricopeptide repeat protein [Oscillatoria amoena NRMC-F 0135]|nr:tetratricopeptide repeat protein [Oscillatoria amoena NRMC-F 0135]